MRIIHSSLVPVRNGIDYIKVEDLPICRNNPINPKYQEILDALQNVENFKPVCIDDYLPKDILKRPSFLKELELPFQTTLYIYYHGNYLGNLHWYWKQESEINDNNKTKDTQAIIEVY